MKKKTKTFVLPLIGGKECRIKKAEVLTVDEQYNIDGGIDTGVCMKSGYCYLVDMPKEILEQELFNGRFISGN